MIDVKVRGERITVTGHAGFGTDGYDIICAAVTALAVTLRKSINDLTDDKVECRSELGLFDMNFKNLSEKSKTLVDSFFIGISAVANDFPGHVRII